jgi:FtsH-binding integral membrane protein
MAQTPVPNQQQQQYPTGVNPQLIKDGEFRDDGTMEDQDLMIKDEAEDHIGYVRKVLGIVATQMTFTFLLAASAANFAPVGRFFKHPLTLILSFCLLITCMCVIVGSKKARRTVPQNYLWLAGVTIGESFFLAAVAADLTVFSVFTCILATCIVTGALFAGSMYTASMVDRDVLIRNLVKSIVTAFIINIVCLIIILFAYRPQDKWIVFAVSCVMVPVVGAYIVFALLFIIVPGIEDRDDYILGAMRLYLEIARLFYYLMRIFGEKK